MKITIPSDNAGNLKLTQRLQRVLFPKAMARYDFRYRLTAVVAVVVYCVLIGFCIWILDGLVSDEVFIGILLASIAIFLTGLVLIQKRVRADLENDVLESMNKRFPDGTPIVLSIEKDGIRSRSKSIDLFVKWSGIFAIEPLDDDATAILNGRMSFAIPHSIFKDDAEKNAFRDELKRHWKAGRIHNGER